MTSSAKHTQGGRERRAHPRAVCDGSLTLQLDEGAYRARLRDVSRAGISFYLDRPVAEMTVLAVRIELPARGGQAACRIDGSGVVVRCLPISKGVDHYEIAVFLNHLGDEQRLLLDRYVALA